jgi:glycosyltransferase involved in cell wall biosynthesis
MKELSVIICTYNRDKFIATALNSLKNQTFAKEKYEIIIVNNNSTDNTETICKQFQKDNDDLNITYVIEQNHGLSFARNKGIEVSDAPLIAYIDDDAIARNDFVEILLKSFKTFPDYGAIGGKVIPIYPTGQEPIWMSRYLWGIVSKVDYGDKTKPFSKKFPVGCNMAFRKELFKTYGGFNTDLVYRGDDKYVFYKLKRYNIKILYVPDVFVFHYIDTYRIEPKFIDKISKSVGASERLRLQNEKWYKSFFKFIEYVYKFGASIILAVMFLLQGKPIKGKYCVRLMRHTMIGFFRAKNNAQL